MNSSLILYCYLRESLSSSRRLTFGFFLPLSLSLSSSVVPSLVRPAERRQVKLKAQARTLMAFISQSRYSTKQLQMLDC